MKIHLLRDAATPEQAAEMLQTLQTYVKLAADIERDVVAGGGTMQADCESVLLQDGSQQEDIWGADWDPSAREVHFEALINIRPRQNNRSMVIQDPEIRKRVDSLVRRIFAGTQ